ncbi:hypothetical protein I314_03381 [Cryptococcus bacillisporus CA1873]|uniref:Unplaced genomic scaffold supercont1.8, whole genome shotgun sequence n=2 Tax=Cryptococcus gattii TaxID=552467 RepID=A0A0D0VJD3_CRYGA|nr:hypothetical protein I312_03270 [Cryptococcus bacillisporus CA1280]KIR62439.1 hypothetical protein I314_03381 [Cryptococcus bacillisporus CA1873]|eukprot:KIR62439.1 hypothetical protein I314_03381 [Cryptococcus gattii CA1873]
MSTLSQHSTTSLNTKKSSTKPPSSILSPRIPSPTNVPSSVDSPNPQHHHHDHMHAHSPTGAKHTGLGIPQGDGFPPMNGMDPKCGGCGLVIDQESGGVVVAFGCAKCKEKVSADTNLLLLSDGSPVCGNCSYQVSSIPS